MKVTPEIAELIMKEASSIEIAKASQRAGFTICGNPHFESYAGLTSLEEANHHQGLN